MLFAQAVSERGRSFRQHRDFAAVDRRDPRDGLCGSRGRDRRQNGAYARLPPRPRLASAFGEPSNSLAYAHGSIPQPATIF